MLQAVVRGMRRGPVRDERVDNAEQRSKRHRNVMAVNASVQRSPKEMGRVRAYGL